MAKKKSIRAEDISEKDILSLYDSVLPLLYDNPKKIDPINIIYKRITGYVYFDFAHHILWEPDADEPLDRFTTTFEKKDGDEKKNEYSKISLQLTTSEDPEIAFPEMIERSYRNQIEVWKKKSPGDDSFYYHRIISNNEPQIAIGFVRAKDKKNDPSFSKNDLAIIKKLTPHLLILFRTVLNNAINSQTYQHFNSYSNTGAKIAKEYHLSETENKFLMEILFGYSNEEIAKRNFISILTVKKHIQHIFKKTGVKSRLDFISRFFTSPERVEL